MTTDGAAALALELPQHIDSTMMTAFRSCHKKYELEFAGGFRPAVTSVDLHAGACFADALETVRRYIWEHNWTLDAALLKAQARFFCEWGDFEIPDWKKTAKDKDRMWEAVEDYFRAYAPRTDHVQPYFASDGKATFEYTFAIPLEPADSIEAAGLFPLHPNGEPFLYSGRFDMLGTYSGMPVWLDEKTSGRSPSAGWSEAWDLRNQFLGYTWACQQGGLALKGGVVRGITILMKEIKHIEAVKLYPQYMLDRWYEQLRRDLWKLRRCWDEGYFDYNFGDACTSYGNCAFLPVCTSATPASWLSNYVVRRWNPLKKNPIAPILVP